MPNAEIVNCKRDVCIDIAKGIALICVYLGHSISSELMSCQFVYRFHLPLFFLLAGCFYRQVEVRIAIRKAYEVYFVPFVFFWFLTLVCMLLTFPLFGFCKALVQHLHPRALLETFVFGEPKFNRSLWFLYSLGGIYLVVSIINSVLKSKSFLLLVLAVSLVLGSVAGYNQSHLPFHLETVPVGMEFYLLGVLFKRHVLEYLSKVQSLGVAISGFIASVLVVLFSLQINAPVNMHNGCLPILLFPVALCGCVGVILLATLIKRVAYLGPAIAFIGRNSLVYFACEASVCYWTIEFFCHFFGIRINHDSIAQGLSLVIVKIFIASVCYPLVARACSAFKRSACNELWGRRIIANK